MKRFALPLAALLALTACTPPSQNLLTARTQQCAAGFVGACQELPGLQTQVAIEQQQQQATSAAVGLGVAVGVLDILLILGSGGHYHGSHYRH